MVLPIVAAGLHGTKAGDFLPLSPEILQMVEMKRDEILGGTPSEFASAQNYRAYQEQVEAEEAAMWAEAEMEADIIGDEIKSRADHINRNPEFSFFNPPETKSKPPTLWTPDGEVTVH